MSDPSLQLRSAESIKYGLLAARSSEAIARAEAHQELTSEDQTILEEAEEFLRQVADGAAFISTGAHPRGSVISSTDAFGFALQPVESLDLLKDRQAPDVFNELARAVHQISAGQASTLEEVDITNARAFFDRLYASALELLEINRLRPAAVGRRALLGQLT
ncbi:hypothetical protein [Pseudoxanthomonas sp. CF125]|uniref:hypothetical protein n=1 Tax=Pseudoxanthomonas sp. CF125 TaxID=1855303 RepID=UPI000B84F6C2|nr:hypothetical protein [Pseudoxanthomonas sp. CF125]